MKNNTHLLELFVWRKNSKVKKVKITALLSVYDLSYEMSALLSSEERSEMHKTAIEQQRQAVQFYLDKYADPEIEFESHIVWNSNEADAINDEVEKINMISL